MSEHTIAAPTSEAMQELRRVAGMVHGGDVLLLSGPLGAGKTTFAQGFGAGLDITEPIVSPTFTIARELDGHFADGTPAHLVHVDAYRLGGSAYAPGQDAIGRLLDELESLGLDEELEDPGENTVVLMEWGEQMATALAPERLEIHIDRPLDSSDVASAGSDGELTVPSHSSQSASDGPRSTCNKPCAHRLLDVHSLEALRLGGFMGCTLVIDTSFGSTVGIVGREPIVETDSRTHVEKLQVNIARAVEEAGLTPADIEEIVVGIGPAPFTGLRAGIVAAKALAFATGAKLVGQNVLDPQGEMMNFVLGDSAMFDGIDFLADVPRLSSRQSDGDVPDAEAKEHELDRHVTLCVNDARRKQLYFSLNHGSISLPDEDAAERRWIEMDIDYPEHIVERVNAALAEHGERDGVSYVVDVTGHGAAKYASVWQGLRALGSVVDGSVLDAGKAGLAVFATTALSRELRGDQVVPIEPLYLRRPDAEVPNPLKHVLGHAGADKA